MLEMTIGGAAYSYRKSFSWGVCERDENRAGSGILVSSSRAQPRDLFRLPCSFSCVERSA